MKKIYITIFLLNLILGCSSTQTTDFLEGVLDVVEANPQILNGDFESPIIIPEYEDLGNTLSEDNIVNSNLDSSESNVVDKIYHPNGQLKWEFFETGEFRIDRYYREDGSYEAETKFNITNNTFEQKLFDNNGELKTHNFYDSNSTLISREKYDKLNASKNTNVKNVEETNIEQIKNSETITSKNSEGMDEEVRKYLNSPASPIVSRDRLIKYLNNLDGARVETNYHSNGMLSSKVYYKNGKFELYKNYDENGKLVKILVYDIEVGAQYE